MSIWVMSLFIFGGSMDIDLEELGIYSSDHQYSAARYGDDLYLVSDGDDLILKLDPGLKILASYAKNGDGPGELKNPVIVGADAEFIWILNRRLFLMKFDHQLKLVQDNLALPRMFGNGVMSKDGAINLIDIGSTDKQINSFVIKNNKCIEQRRFGDIRGAWFEQGSVRASLDNDQFFVYTLHPENMESYEVEVFKYDAHGEKRVRTLRADLTAIKSANKHLLTCAAASLKDGYLVQLLLSHPNRHPEAAFLDHFDKKGAFVKREECGKINVFLLSVIGSEETLIIDLDELKAHFVVE